ncbi:MAG: hypothetical protein N2690_09535, partial [Rhodocyclaceae bacterium]|nr:hypothetical protein [Rhodocyclaceae bacterium]
MPQRRVLFLDAAGLTAYRVGGGRIEAEGRFPPDEAGLADFAAYLAHHAGSLFMMLADVAEEGFQLEDIPASSGKDRQAIIKRKLAQYFYGTPFAIAQSLGRLKTGRRDERVLLMALTRPPFFEPWLAQLRATRSILAGLWSLPQVVGQLLPAAAPAQSLLITQTGGALRQTFFLDGQLRFSRLTPLVSASADEAAIAALLEASKMHQYLASQRLIGRGKPLVTRVLVHPAQAAAMRARCRDNAELRFECADLLEEARRAGLHTPLEDARAAVALFCHLLARKPPAEQFAPPAERQYYRLWQTRYALKSASAVILASGLLIAGNLGMEIFQKQGEIERLRQEALLARQGYDAVMQALPKIPLTTDELRALVDRCLLYTS